MNLFCITTSVAYAKNADAYDILQKLEFSNVSLNFSLRCPCNYYRTEHASELFSRFWGLTLPLSIEMMQHESDFTIPLDFMTILITVGLCWFLVLESFPEADLMA